MANETRWRCCSDRSIWLRGVDRYRRVGSFLTADRHSNIQNEPTSPSSHPEAPAQGDELGYRLVPALEPDRLVHGRSDCGEKAEPRAIRGGQPRYRGSCS